MTNSVGMYTQSNLWNYVCRSHTLYSFKCVGLFSLPMEVFLRIDTSGRGVICGSPFNKYC